jgi:hypothetical protein
MRPSRSTRAYLHHYSWFPKGALRRRWRPSRKMSRGRQSRRRSAPLPLATCAAPPPRHRRALYSIGLATRRVLVLRRGMPSVTPTRIEEPPNPSCPAARTPLTAPRARISALASQNGMAPVCPRGFRSCGKGSGAALVPRDGSRITAGGTAAMQDESACRIRYTR